MSVSFQKMIAATSVLALLVVVSNASAAISLGFPAGRPYYGSNQHARNSYSYRSYAPANSTESRQSFSYEPADKSTAAQQGNADNHTAPKAAQKSTTNEHVATAPQTTTTRQSFSYEPATQRRGLVRRSAHRDNWQYQKTDTRRTN